MLALQARRAASALLRKVCVAMQDDGMWRASSIRTNIRINSMADIIVIFGGKGLDGERFFSFVCLSVFQFYTSCLLSQHLLSCLHTYHRSPRSQLPAFSHWKLQELAGFDLCRVKSLELIRTISSADGRGNIKEMAFSVVFV